MELVEQSSSTPMAEAEGQGQQADQPAETMGDVMGVSAVTMSEATLEVDTPIGSDGGPGHGGVGLTNGAVEDEAVSVVEAEDEAAAVRRPDDASHVEAEDDDAWVAAVELERDAIAELLTSGLAVDVMVRTLEERNPAPGTLCSMVLELLCGGIEPQVIFSQLRWAAGAEPQPEVQLPPDETEHFLGGVAPSHAGEGGSSDGSVEDEEEAARGAASRRRRPGYAPLGDSDAGGEHGGVEHFEVEQGDAEQGGVGGGGGRLSPGLRLRRRRRRPLPGEEAGDYHELVEVGRQVSAFGRQASASAIGALRGRGRAVCRALALCAAAAVTLTLALALALTLTLTLTSSEALLRQVKSAGHICWESCITRGPDLRSSMCTHWIRGRVRGRD